MTETSPLITINRFEPGLNRFGTVGIPVPGVQVKIDSDNDEEGEIRPEVSGPVFSYGDNGAVYMRYSARKRNIQWRDDGVTSAAREFLSEILADRNGEVFHYRLQPGEGLVSSNVLHNRTAFSDGAGRNRLLYRARFFDRIRTS